MTQVNYVTKQDVYEIVEEVVTRVVGDLLGGAMQTIADHIDKRFNEVDKRFDKLEGRMGNIEKRMGSIEQQMNRIEDKMDSVVAVTEHHSIDIRELRRKVA